MSDSGSFRAAINAAYRDFFQTAERKRHWSVFDDIPWDRLDRSRNNENKAVRLETYCAEEMYVPDYASNGLAMTRTHFGSVWFQMCWTQEEAKHGLVFREYLLRSGLRSEAEIDRIEDDIYAHAWQLPFKTSRRMACYGALQEQVTFLAYKAQKELARSEGDEVLEAIFGFVSRDEAAHAGFYREMVQLELMQDRIGTLADLAAVIAAFKMPGDGLIPHYQERLRSSGAGVSPRHFVEHALLPMLRTLKTDRAELKQAQQTSAALAPAPAELVF